MRIILGLDPTRVDDVADPGYRQRGLRDIRGEDDLPRARLGGEEDLLLDGRLLRGVEGEREELDAGVRQVLGDEPDLRGHRLDLLLAREEDEDVGPGQ